MKIEPVDPEEFKYAEEAEARHSHVEEYGYFYSTCTFCSLEYPIQLRMDAERFVPVCPNCDKRNGQSIDFTLRIPAETFETWKLESLLTEEDKAILEFIYTRRHDDYWDRY